MPEPEIARRCPSCGVFIRVRASFCPQCGKVWEPKLDAAAKDAEVQVPESASAAELSGDTSGSVANREVESDNAAAAPTVAALNKGGFRKPPRQATVGMLHRAGGAARDVVGDDVRPRVEKFRHISSVVLDEAAYDPSLRFVLVAAVLFVLFLFLLLLSELIT